MNKTNPHLQTLSDEYLIEASKELKLMIIPEDAKIRKLSIIIYGVDDVMHMTIMLGIELAIALGERLNGWINN